ncbi:MAG: hypothetical protein ACREDS_06900 [Limisphaerales bacterium]
MIDGLRFTISKNFSADNWKTVQPIVQLDENPTKANAPKANQTNEYWNQNFITDSKFN